VDHLEVLEDVVRGPKKKRKKIVSADRKKNVE
jgi:hypothetical protein